MSTLRMSSGIPEDAAVNTFHLSKVTPISSPDWTTIVAAWATFMGSIKSNFPATVNGPGHGFKAYDLASPEPRAPVLDTTWSLGTAPTGDPLPSEVALCVSFEGERSSGNPQARRRGRMYFGPMNTGSMNSGTGRPADSRRDAACTALKTFIDACSALTVDFIVWSRANEQPVLVKHIWADNAYDTQRRRGLVPTGRYNITW
jgi:hypothetical protein